MKHITLKVAYNLLGWDLNCLMFTCDSSTSCLLIQLLQKKKSVSELLKRIQNTAKRLWWNILQKLLTNFIQRSTLDVYQDYENACVLLLI